MEDSGSVSKETGWISQHILLSHNNSIVGILPNFIKNHSWGEYIFDQVFAQALENAGGKYYPKLLSAVPFSPVPGERFLIKAGYPKHITSTASLFILINSIFGIAGQLTKNISLSEFLNYWPLFVAVLIGGQIGSNLNIKFLSNRILAVTTSLLVIFVAVRMGFRILS